jgi:hypothetical protein
MIPGYVGLQITDAGYLSKISQIPDDGHNRQSKHVGEQKLNTVQ